VNAVTGQEVEKLLAIRRHRNVVVHDLPRMLLEPKLEVDIDLLIESRNFTHKLDRWWFENYHATIDPEVLGGQSADETEFSSFRMVYVDHVIANVLDGLSLSQPSEPSSESPTASGSRDHAEGVYVGPWRAPKRWWRRCSPRAWRGGWGHAGDTSHPGTVRFGPMPSEAYTQVST
jgi:hypothetical protein